MPAHKLSLLCLTALLLVSHVASESKSIESKLDCLCHELHRAAVVKSPVCVRPALEGI